MTTHHLSPAEKRDRIVRTGVIVALAALFIIEVSVLIKDFRGATPLHELRAREYTEIRIEPWMTFRYVNTLYHLDPSFFKTILGIGDERYPDIEIRKFAKDRSVDPEALIRDIIGVIKRGV